MFSRWDNFPPYEQVLIPYSSIIPKLFFLWKALVMPSMKVCASISPDEINGSVLPFSAHAVGFTCNASRYCMTVKRKSRVYNSRDVFNPPTGIAAINIVKKIITTGVQFK